MTLLRNINEYTQPFTAAENRGDGQMSVQVLSLAALPFFRPQGHSGTITCLLGVVVSSEPHLGGLCLKAKSQLVRAGSGAGGGELKSTGDLLSGLAGGRGLFERRMK